MVRFRLFRRKKKEKVKEEEIALEKPEEIVEVEPVEEIKETISPEDNIEISEEKKEETFASTPTDYYETLVSSDAEETKMVEIEEEKKWTRTTWEDISEIEKKIDEMKIEPISKRETNMEKKIDRIISKSK